VRFGSFGRSLKKVFKESLSEIKNDRFDQIDLSVFVAESRKPRIEMVFHNILEFDPDEYVPIMMRAQGTKRNTRIVFSNQCSCYGHPKNRRKNKFETLEINVPIEIESVERGQLVISPKEELEIGEYAITWISKRDGTAGARLGLWTFSVRQ